MSDFDVSLVTAEIRRRTYHVERQITRGGIVPEGKVTDIVLEVTNGTSDHIRWLNVDTYTSEAYEARRAAWWNPDTVRTTTEYRDWDKTYSFEDIAPNRTVQVKVNAFPYIVRIYGEQFEVDKSPYITKIYGELASGQTFEREIKGGVCFVTTAAYGNPHHPMVEEFRMLRDQVLANYRFGLRFIGWYNRRGPQLAAIIEDRPRLQTTARTLLTPVALVIRSARAAIRATKYLTSSLH